MRYGILSDIHGNLDAFEAVLEALKRENVDQLLCLGDIVGYGAQPSECTMLVRDLCSHAVAGNHDYAVLDRIGIQYFNVYAQESTLWTRDQLKPEDRSYLEGLPLVEHFDTFSIVHSTLYSPELFDYIQTSYDAFLSMEVLPGRVCFLGHSHVPITFVQKEVISYSLEKEILVTEDSKVIVNVGSVGQPRDSNPRASFAVYDDDEGWVAIRRVRYDVDQASRKIREAGLPAVLGERLRHGR